jgi:hypothetical protein
MYRNKIEEMKKVQKKYDIIKSEYDIIQAKIDIIVQNKI